MTDFSGQCLCGGVRFDAAIESTVVGMCHCKMCRRWAGGLPLTAVQSRQVTVTADSGLSWWKSSPWGERGFCRVCGSSLFWRSAGGEGTAWTVSAGALNDDDRLTLKEHIFYDDKAPFYEFADSTPRLRGVEFTAKVLGELAAQHGDGFLAMALAQLSEHSGGAFADEVKQRIEQQAGN